MKILFWINRSKINKKGTVPIILRITIAGESFQFSTGLRVRPQNWNNKRKRAYGDKVLNANIKSFETKILVIASNLRTKDDFTIKAFKNALAVKKKDNTPAHLKKIIEDYRLIQINKKTNYTSDRFYINIYLFFTLKNYKYITDINCNVFFEEFRQFLTQYKKSNSEEYHKKNIRYLLASFELAERKKTIKRNPFKTAILPKLKRKPKKFTLTKKQVNQLKTKEIQSERLSKVRDLFLFQCYTGLSYADLAIFDGKQINTISKLKVIQGKRTKTKTDYTTILTKTAKKILKKYDNSLPIISNQKYNVYLKELAEICDIKEKLTTHAARRTFGQLMLNKGVSIEAVSRMLGHSNIKTTQAHYASAGTTLVVNQLKKIKKKKKK